MSEQVEIYLKDYEFSEDIIELEKPCGYIDGKPYWAIGEKMCAVRTISPPIIYDDVYSYHNKDEHKTIDGFVKDFKKEYGWYSLPKSDRQAIFNGLIKEAKEMGYSHITYF